MVYQYKQNVFIMLVKKKLDTISFISKWSHTAKLFILFFSIISFCELGNKKI